MESCLEVELPVDDVTSINNKFIRNVTRTKPKHLQTISKFPSDKEWVSLYEPAPTSSRLWLQNVQNIDISDNFYTSGPYWML